ncbi:MAG: hypothetical protein NUV67_02430 [archaeon]|nr:hypothetical protein [archaeon]
MQKSRLEILLTLFLSVGAIFLMWAALPLINIYFELSFASNNQELLFNSLVSVGTAIGVAAGFYTRRKLEHTTASIAKKILIALILGGYGLFEFLTKFPEQANNLYFALLLPAIFVIFMIGIFARDILGEQRIGSNAYLTVLKGESYLFYLAIIPANLVYFLYTFLFGTIAEFKLPLAMVSINMGIILVIIIGLAMKKVFFEKNKEEIALNATSN